MRPQQEVATTYFTVDEPTTSSNWLFASSLEKPSPASTVKEPSTQPESTKWSLATETKHIFYNLKHDVLSTARRPDFSTAMEPVVLLGVAYVPTGSDGPKNVGETVRAAPQYLSTHFHQRFSRLFWATYRSKFRELRTAAGAAIDSDAGWGCTLRVGQMMLLETLARAKHSYGRSDEHALLRLVQENTEDAAFSLHSLLHTAAALRRFPGDWFSPVAVAHLLQQHTLQHPLDLIQVTVHMDGTINLDQLVAAATALTVEQVHGICYCAQHKISLLEIGEDSGFSGSYLSDTSSLTDEYEDLDPGRKCAFCNKPLGPPWQSSVFLLVPLMLGLGDIHADCYAGVKALLSLPQSVGIIGGKPRSAYYIVGYQGDSVVYLDPHYVQPACRDYIDTASYHCDQPRVLRLADAESSVAAGFFLQDEADFRDFVKRLERAKAALHSVVHVQEVSRPLTEVEDSANCLFFESPELDYIHV